MPGRTTFEPGEIAQSKTMIASLVADRITLVGAGADPVALAASDPEFYTALTLVLDRPFVDRARIVGPGVGPLNELGLIVESLIAHAGVFTVAADGAYDPEASITGLVPGEPVRLTADRFERLAVGVFAELEELFVERD